MNSPISRTRCRFAAFTTILLLGTAATGAQAQVISLQNATATFSQTNSGDFSVARAIDNITNDGLGWAIFGSPASGDPTSAQTAVFETVTDAGFAGGTQLTFSIQQLYNSPGGHLVGRFRLSLTQDSRANFADGLQSGGDVTAAWVVLTPSSLVSANGATLTTLADSSILSSNLLPATDTYTIVANTPLTGITGFRLETFDDTSLPTNGPGRQPSNGNFVVSEFTVSAARAPVSAAPEPATVALFGLGLIAATAVRRRSRPAGAA